MSRCGGSDQDRGSILLSAAAARRAARCSVLWRITLSFADWCGRAWSVCEYPLIRTRLPAARRKVMPAGHSTKNCLSDIYL
jgi:hypothetical protein